MQRAVGLDGLRSLPPGAVLSIGNFDGVHTGHAAILRVVRAAADDAAAPGVVVTFEPHPLTVLRPELTPPRLTTLATKERLLAGFGIDTLVTLPPTPDVLGMTAMEFWTVLRGVRPGRIVEGQSFNFGKGRGGTIERLIEWAAGTGIAVDRLPAHAVAVGEATIVVSSSVIRSLLKEGRVEDAARCLGRPFELEGEVVQGFQRGRTIGVPTANLAPGEALVPAEGVYAGRTDVDGRRYAVALSIGSTPTFEQRRGQIEAHLVDFAGDLYGRRLSVRVERRLRDQAKYPDVDALKFQLSQDISAARSFALDGGGVG